DLTSGTSSTNVALSSALYLTGTVNLTQPCPKCVAGLCDRGPRAGMACTATSSTGYTRDCPTGGVGTPTSLCPGGQQPGNGQTCCSPLCAGNGATPCSPANGDADCTAGGTPGPCVSPGHCINTPATACTRDADCGGAVGSCVPCNCPCTQGGGQCCDGSHVGVIAINLSPLTTGTASATDPGGLFCPGQTATPPRSQAGCFGITACRTINESGVAAGPVVTGGPADATPASGVFLPAPGFDPVYDATFGRPGPGAVSLPGTFLVHN